MVDLIATGARIVEPDRRVVTAEIYPPPPGQLSLRTSDREPLGAESKRFVIASAETLAYAVATGTIGDPRSFKRPVRVTVPRALPTDDVLIVRERRVESASSKRPVPASPSSQPVWGSGVDLELCEGLPAEGAEPKAGFALLLQTLDEVRQAAQRALGDGSLKAVIAPFVPSGLVALFAGAGILALSADAGTLRLLKGQKTLAIAPVTSATDGAIVVVTPNRGRVDLAWLAIGAERGWTLSGTSRPNPAPPRARST